MVRLTRPEQGRPGAPLRASADAPEIGIPDIGAGLTMGEASRLLGVPAPTLRAWERRYGVPFAPRGPGQHRRFTEEMLGQIALLRDEIARGTRAAEAADMVRTMTPRAGPATACVREFLDAALQLDAPRLRAALDASLATLGLAAAVDGVLMPAMRQIGSWWSGGSCDVAHEHLATATVRAWLAGQTAAARSAEKSAPVVLASGPRDQHTIGLEALGAILVHGGWPVVQLGARTPARDLQMTARATGAASVVVASQMPTGRRAAIAAIDMAAETGLPVFIAGKAFAQTRMRAGVAGTYLGPSLAVAAQTIMGEVVHGRT